MRCIYFAHKPRQRLNCQLPQIQTLPHLETTCIFYPPLLYQNEVLGCQREGVKSESESHSVVSNSAIPMDCSLTGSSVHGISQARILEWVAISFSRGIFSTQESNRGLPHSRQILYRLSQQGVGTDYSHSPLASHTFSNIFNDPVSTSTFLVAFFPSKAEQELTRTNVGERRVRVSQAEAGALMPFGRRNMQTPSDQRAHSIGWSDGMGLQRAARARHHPAPCPSSVLLRAPEGHRGVEAVTVVEVVEHVNFVTTTSGF